MRIFFQLFLLLSLVGCSRYSVDINNNQVYTPPIIYTQYSIEDPRLQTCFDQAIKDHLVTTATDLKIVQCSYAGVKELKGISAFSRIEQLSLKGNEISSIEQLLQLTHLRYLDLSDNPVDDCQTLKQLKNLVTEVLIHNSECK